MPRSKRQDESSGAGGLFARPPSPRRSRMVTVRLTEGQDRVLNEACARLEMDRADVVRRALDFWLTHGSEAGRLRDLLKGE